MKKFLLFFLFPLLSVAQEQTAFKYHSYTEFFHMIENSEDSIFQYTDAIIRFDSTTDARFQVHIISEDTIFQTIEYPKVVINKELHLDNVHFIADYELRTINEKAYEVISGALYNFTFNKKVQLYNTISFHFFKGVVNGEFDLENIDFIVPEPLTQRSIYKNIHFEQNKIYKDFNLVSTWQISSNRSLIKIIENQITIDQHTRGYAFSVYTHNLRALFLIKNVFRTKGPNYITNNRIQWIDMSDNTFNTTTYLGIGEMYGLNRLFFTNNHFEPYLRLGMSSFPQTTVIDWEQMEDRLIIMDGFGPYIEYLGVQHMTSSFTNPSLHKEYYANSRLTYDKSYEGEMSFRGKLHHHYKSNYLIEKANAVFINLKDLETRKLEILYRENPSFRRYFRWKVNQFLKFFSDYGTDPAKAIVFSVYVILVFALIYLFFPNSWDSHGRNRLLDRFKFFMKYMNQQEGIHEVYLEDKREENQEYEDFRLVLEGHRSKVPTVFYKAALPLYKWSVSGTRLYAWFLAKVDFLNGEWSETPMKSRASKTLLLMIAFSIALLYDLTIKMLNAIMLSINTFTTLGFGEIPIKGLPRYLAIIEGFIGWFMLTIFSVSLISQLLN